jgi:uncharacterized membrane protein
MQFPLYVTVGSVIAASLVVLALGFGYRIWVERSRRDPALPVQDRTFFERQDRRRLAGSVLMLAIASSMGLGLALSPPTTRAEARTWGIAWLAASLFVCVLLVLAMVDWLAIRVYANRHRRALFRERLDALHAESQRLGMRNGEEPGR